jgi:hypothetical protein
MSNNMKELATAQEKLRLIDKLSNILQSDELSNEDKKELAYLIHRIIDASECHSDIYRECMGWAIASHRSDFVTEQ